MKYAFINLTKYLRQSIIFVSLKKSIRLFCLPFYYIIYTITNFCNYLFKLTILNSVNNIEIKKNDYSYYYHKKKWLFFRFNNFFLLLDLIYAFYLAMPFKKSKFNNFNFRVKSRLKQVNWAFYNNLHNKTNNSYFNYYFVHYLSGLRFLWNGLKYWILGLILGLSAFYYLTYIRLLPFNKVIFEWILIVMFLYWFLSGFTFFIKKYQYSKFTSVIPFLLVMVALAYSIYLFIH